MLERWLGEDSIHAFRGSHLGRRPLARSAAALDARALFDWEVLDRVLGSPDLDALVVRSGREEAVTLPRDLAGLRRLFARGLGLVVRRAERHDEALASLAEAFTRDLGGRTHVQLFVTAKATSGFSWHYDAEEVFIVQTVGQKTYYFRANTIDPDTRERRPDFARIAEETSPTMTCTLIAGDWLYLPRGYWHVAKADEDSLSISIGVRPGARTDTRRNGVRQS